ncbi:VWA domain-containing protein [Nonomuraea rubra]|uniref:Ca-activated chloride channel family protein n=1 Tax=Nonomuraea rubra TaxID=46180 RepID=A0A7X0NT12_9ACTN|nr:VWA domain-containing protein [Nonomuraea rubra]MBB6549086.1 Ca-activated chloride channel family protein [Nonomuraea rubra]
MDPTTGFTLRAGQMKYVSRDARETHAIIEVTAGGTFQEAEAAEVIVLDCSDSMNLPWTKLAQARKAGAAAIEALRDGVRFGLIAGNHEARMIYPEDERLVAATRETKDEAKQAVRRLIASGATSMGAWLRLADTLLAAHPDAVRHLVLLTDGRNLPAYRQDLDDALTRCRGRFDCHGLGLGDDYDPGELQRVVSALRGSAEAVQHGSDLARMAAELVRRSMSRRVPGVWIRIRTTRVARVSEVRQEFPAKADLTGLGRRIAPNVMSYSTGAWEQGETRHFHLRLRLDLAHLPPGEDVLAAQVAVADAEAGGHGEPVAVAGGHGEPVAVLVHRTDDSALSSVLDPEVDHYLRHHELAKATTAGWEAYNEGNGDLAARQWGRAVALAAGLGDRVQLEALGRLVHVVGDPAEGVVRIRPDLQRRDISRSVFASHQPPRPPRAAAPSPSSEGVSGRICGRGHPSPPDARFCEECGYTWSGSA